MMPVAPRSLDDLPRYQQALYLRLTERNVANLDMDLTKARAHAQAEAQAQSDSLKAQLQRDAYVPSQRR